MKWIVAALLVLTPAGAWVFFSGYEALRLPRFEPLLYDASEGWTAVTLKLVPRSDLVVLAESDHEQWEAFPRRFLYAAPWWNGDEPTSRLVQAGPGGDCVE